MNRSTNLSLVPESPVQRMAAQLAETVMQGRPLLLTVNGMPAAIIFMSSDGWGLEDVLPIALSEDWRGQDLIYALGLLEEGHDNIDYSQVTAAVVDGTSFDDFYGRRVIYRIVGGVGERSLLQQARLEQATSVAT